MSKPRLLDVKGESGLPDITHVFLLVDLFIAGSVFGSFAAALGERSTRGESVIRPRSHCTNCGKPLAAFELIPIWSWLLLKGRCRRCHIRIPIHYPIAESTLGTVAVLLCWQSSSWLAALVSSLLWFTLVVAMSTDVIVLMVPNWLTYSNAIVVYVLMSLLERNFVKPLFFMLVGFGIPLLVYFLSRGRMGLGDAKLYASIGAVLGPWLTIESFVFSSIFGAVIGLFLRCTGQFHKKQLIPFVPFIVMGVGSAEFLANGLPQWYIHTLLHLG
ncbi:prepilin peptidase [Alicyclobacillus fodiniaquatilis]|uniref:Prepilin peptidase n=1 Tax=Alicyclobacillus fodiniaquatilis TaxID=1661150 RepID=A0ABW4JGB2_9BACL